MLNKVSKCNRISECIADKRCVWNGNPANKDLKCAFFEQKIKNAQEKQLYLEHIPEFKRLTNIDKKILKLESDKSRKVNVLLSQVYKVKIQFDQKIVRLKAQKEKVMISIYGIKKGEEL